MTDSELMLQYEFLLLFTAYEMLKKHFNKKFLLSTECNIMYYERRQIFAWGTNFVRKSCSQEIKIFFALGQK